MANGASKLFLDGAVVAFHQLSLAVRRNEIMCVVGPTGCGKTTLLRCIAGLTDLRAGSFWCRASRSTGRPPDGVAMVFQHFGLLPWKTVYDNAAFGLAMAGAPRARIKETVAHYLELVGLTGFERHYPYQLSGGMQQRVGLVRALAMNPSVLLMDEPFAALDAQTREILQEELLALMQRPDERKTMVFITHSIDEAIVLGDRIAVMSARPGRIKEVLDMPFGRPRDVDAVRSDPRFAELRLHIWRQLHTAKPRQLRARQGRSRDDDRAGPRRRAAGAGRRANLSDDKARAERVATDRRHRRQWQIIGIRVASLAIVLTLWQMVGAHIDPVLFTTPSKVVVAAVDMIGSGELWTYLWPSLVVLASGSRSRRCSASRSGCCWRASGFSTWRSASTSRSSIRSPRSRWCR